MTCRQEAWRREMITSSKVRSLSHECAMYSPRRIHALLQCVHHALHLHPLGLRVHLPADLRDLPLHPGAHGGLAFGDQRLRPQCMFCAQSKAVVC